MIYVFLADGCEEVEALAPVDILRRANLDVMTVGIGKKTVTGAHGIEIIADITEKEMKTDGLQLLVLPGGGGGTAELCRSESVREMLLYAAENDIPIGAICAAPTVLGALSLLKGKKAVSYPGTEAELLGADVQTGAGVVRDGIIITAEAMGSAIPFGLALVELLKGPEEAERVRTDICFR